MRIDGQAGCMVTQAECRSKHTLLEPRRRRIEAYGGMDDCKHMNLRRIETGR